MVQYCTDDGCTFDSRVAARKHEIDDQRRRRIGACLERALKGTHGKTIAVIDVAEAICKHVDEFADALSARAAVRAKNASRRRKLEIE